MVIALVNARVLTPDEEIPRATVVLGKKRIARGLEGPAWRPRTGGLELAMTSMGGESAFCWSRGSAV